MEFREFEIAGAPRIGVRDFGGAGDAVLLLHGAGRNLEDLTAIAGNLAADHRVAAMDLRGHGRSGDGPWSSDAILDDIARVLTALGYERATLAGHSLGGMLAALYAARRGGVAAVIDWDGFGDGLPEHYLGIPREAARSFRTAMREGAALSYREDPRIDSEELAEHLASRIAQATALGLPVAGELAAALRGIGTEPDGSSRLHPLRGMMRELLDETGETRWFDVFAETPVPVLLYRAEAMPPVPDDARAMLDALSTGLRAELEALSAAHPRIEARFLPDQGHGLVIGIPDRLAHEAREWIAAHAGA